MDAADDDWMRVRLTAIAERRDRSAFTDLFGYLAPRFKAFALAKGVAERQAEDIVQESMLLIWTRAATFQPDLGGPMTWFFTIVRNKCVDLARSESRRRTESNDIPEQADDERYGPEAITSANLTRARLDDALAALNAGQRSVLRKAFFEEKSHAVVATELGIPIGTVKSRLRVAYERLRATLTESRP